MHELCPSNHDVAFFKFHFSASCLFWQIRGLVILNFILRVLFNLNIFYDILSQVGGNFVITINQKVYYVNDIGFTIEQLYTIVEITPSLVIIERKFIGKRNTPRKFQIHVNHRIAEKVLYSDLSEAIQFSNERKALTKSGVFPFKVGDKIAWNNGKHTGTISKITNRSYIINNPTRVWSLDPYILDIVKLN